MVYGKIEVDQIESSSGLVLETEKITTQLKALSLSLGCKLKQIVEATDTTTALNPATGTQVLYVFDAENQVTYGVPALTTTGETIVSVSGSELTTSTEEVYTLSNNGKRYTVNTVADLSNLPSLTGARVEWMGYYAVADGGSNWGVIKSGAHVADGGSIFSINYNTYVECNLKGSSVNVKKFGVSDSVLDNTTQMQAAVDYLNSVGGGALYYPAGSYNIASAVNVSSTPIILIGESRFATTIVQTSSDENIFNIGSSFSGLRGMSLRYSETPTAGAATYITGSYATLNDFVIRNSYVGVRFQDTVGGKMSNFEILDYETVGVQADNVNDIFVDKFILNAGDVSRGLFGGFRLTNKVEAFICTNGDVLLGRYSLTTDAANNTVGERPAYNNFSNVFFDSAELGALLNKSVETDFMGCWFSGGRSGTGVAGLTLVDTENTSFTSTKFFNCGGHGLQIGAGSSRVVIGQSKFESNSVTAGAGVCHGVNISGSEVTISNSIAHNGLYGGEQGYGVRLETSATNINVVDNLLQGNYTGAVSMSSDAQANKVAGNVGFVTQNKGTDAVTVGQTVSVVAHELSSTPSVEDIVLSCNDNPDSHSVTHYWVDDVTSTTFRIRVDAAVTGTDLPFSWQANSLGD